MPETASLENRRLLNPAFTGLLIARAAAGHWKEAHSGLPFIYSYLVLPLVLHPETRERIPNSIATRLLTWIERNGDVISTVPRRLRELSAATREGLFVASTTGITAIGNSGSIEPTTEDRAILKFEKQLTSNEMADCFKKSNFLGRWLAMSGTMPTVLSAIGIKL